MTNADDWRELLEPPRGGLERLRARIETPVPARRAWRPLAAAACGIVLVVALFELPDFLRREHLRDTLAAALVAPSAVTVANGAALELPSRRADVRIVFIAALPPDAPADAAAR